MKRVWLPMAVLFCLSLLVQAGESPKDLEKMQGTWSVETMIEKGVKPPAEDIKALEVTIAKDVLTVKEKGKPVAVFTMKLDPAKKPKAIDLVHTEKEKDKEIVLTDIGIYEVEGDTVRLCIDEEGKERPKEFASSDKSTFSLIVLKRKK